MAENNFDNAFLDPAYDSIPETSGPDRQDSITSVADHDWLIVREPELDLFPPVQSIPTEGNQLFERLEDTAVGPITVIRQDTAELPYDVYDLADVLAAYDPRELPKLEQRNGKRPVSIPGNDNVILRWNPSGEKRHIPTDYEGIVDHANSFELELKRVKALGIPVLRRNVFIVEQDERNDYRPTIYTAVERHDVPPLSTFAESGPFKPLSGDMEMHLLLCDKAATYLMETPPGAPYISDNLVAPHQFAADGTLFDYDEYIRQSLIGQVSQLHFLKDNWLERLPKSQARTELMERIGHIAWPNRHKG
jgi:hypothetical protein